jgi:hypothetical protein
MSDLNLKREFTCFCWWDQLFARIILRNVYHMSPPCKYIFFAINTRNAMKLHLHVVQSSLVVLQRIKFIDGFKKWLEIRHFIFKTKSLTPKFAMSFDCKVTTHIVMHSGHRHKASGRLILLLISHKRLFFLSNILSLHGYYICVRTVNY